MQIDGGLKILAGNSNPRLAAAVAGHLGIPLLDAKVSPFNDGETRVEIHENVRGADVFVVQSTSYPQNENIMQLLIVIDALRRASAQRVTAVMPYFGYSRQDRKSSSRSPISAKLVANLITTAGANRVLTLDLHAGQIQGFFDIPTDNLPAVNYLGYDILRHYGDRKLMVVSPDVGGVVRARKLADCLGTIIAIVDKRRSAPGVVDSMHLIGDVRGHHCILVDDMIDSGGTLKLAADKLMEGGATGVSAYVTHGVLSGAAIDNIMSSQLHELVITDSIDQPQRVLTCPKIRSISIAPLIGDAIARIAGEESVSELFDWQPPKG